MRIWVCGKTFVVKPAFTGFGQDSESFFNCGSCWRKWWWNSLYGHFSRKNASCARIDRSKSKSVAINTLRPAALLWGKDNLVQLTLLFGTATEFLKCVCWRMFYKQGPVRRWICTSFNTERWSGPSYKRSRSWFRTAESLINSNELKALIHSRTKQATVCMSESLSQWLK